MSLQAPIGQKMARMSAFRCLASILLVRRRRYEDKGRFRSSADGLASRAIVGSRCRISAACLRDPLFEKMGLDGQNCHLARLAVDETAEVDSCVSSRLLIFPFGLLGRLSHRITCAGTI